MAFAARVALSRSLILSLSRSRRIDNDVLQRFHRSPRRSPGSEFGIGDRNIPLLDLRTMVLWTCGEFSATAGGEGASASQFRAEKRERTEVRRRYSSLL